MKTVEAFKKQQEKAVQIQQKLLGFLHEAEDFGIIISPEYIDKLNNSIAKTESDKLKIVLIGGFSEGKTSIAAAWCEKYDKSSMKISQLEATAQVNHYAFDDFELTDTPGLFGFKETENKAKFKDITNKFVSEAHLVLYVMNPNNPIKESHKEELQWLFKDLNLLPRTIFVLSRFDEEVDIEDEKDYQRGLQIKRENIVSRLTDFGILDDNNRDVSIVAVSANPFNKGIEYWLTAQEEFKVLSRIETLQQATAQKIEATGGYQILAVETQYSIIADIMSLHMPAVITRDEQINKEYERFREVYNETQKTLDVLARKMEQSRTELSDFFVNFFKDLILQVRGVSEDTFLDFFERKIGDEGIVLNNEIQTGIKQRIDTVNRDVVRVKLTFNEEIRQYNSVIEKTFADFAAKGIKAGGEYLSLGAVKLTNDTIKAARDLILPNLKFKPWGAVKLANNINKALPIIGEAIGIVFEVGDMIDKAKREKQFKQLINGIVGYFEDRRKELVKLTDDKDQFASLFFPDFKVLQEDFEEIQRKLENKKTLSERFSKWKNLGEAIEVEYRIIEI